MAWLSPSLRSVSEFGPQYGANTKAVAATGSRPRFVRITDVDDSGRLNPDSVVEADLPDCEKYLLEKGDLLFARSGNTVGKTYCHEKENGPCLFAGYFVRFRPNPNLAIPRYVFYYTKSPTYSAWVSGKKRVGGQPNINGQEYAGLKIPLPPPSEQRRIVEILDQADALRKKRAEADKIADRILPALFYKMFGDPATNPKGWDVVEMENILADTRNGLYKHRDFYGRGTHILKMFNIKDGYLDLDRIDQVELTKDENDKYALLTGDILINRVNTRELVGKCAVIPEDLGAAVFESKNIRARVDTNQATPEYVAHYLNTPFGHASLCQGVKHAIGMATINNTDLRGTRIPVPPVSLQEQWSSRVKNLRQSISSSRGASGHLEKLFLVLLHRAFSGDLTVKWREAHMKELLQEMAQQAKELGKGVKG